MPRARLPVALWIAWTVFIVYACTIPFRFSPAPASIAARLHAGLVYPWWSASGGRISFPDFFGNVLLFVPFGAAGAIALRERARVWLLWVVLLGCVLSTFVEGLQLLTDDRMSATSDVLANTIGAAAGALCCERVAAASRRAMRIPAVQSVTTAPAFYPAMVAVLVVVVSVWEPFAFSIDVSEVAHKVRAFVRDPWMYTGINDEGVVALRWLLAGIAVHVWLGQTRYARHATSATLAAVMLGAVGLEGAQFFISSRSPGGEDAFVMAAAGSIGVVLARKRIHRARPAVLAGLLLAATAAAAAMATLSPFVLAQTHQSAMLFPFLSYYQWTSLEVVSHTFELLLMYVPLGFCLPLLVPSRRTGWLAVLAVTIVMAAAMEYWQGWIVGRYSDVTDAGVAVLGAIAGVWASGRGWDLFRKLELKTEN